MSRTTPSCDDRGSVEQVQHLVALDGQQTADDALCDTSAQHHGVILLIHDSPRYLTSCDFRPTAMLLIADELSDYCTAITLYPLVCKRKQTPQRRTV